MGGRPTQSLIFAQPNECKSHTYWRARVRRQWKANEHLLAFRSKGKRPSTKHQGTHTTSNKVYMTTWRLVWQGLRASSLSLETVHEWLLSLNCNKRSDSHTTVLPFCYKCLSKLRLLFYSLRVARAKTSKSWRAKWPVPDSLWSEISKSWRAKWPVPDSLWSGGVTPRGAWGVGGPGGGGLSTQLGLHTATLTFLLIKRQKHAGEVRKLSRRRANEISTK